MFQQPLVLVQPKQLYIYVAETAWGKKTKSYFLNIVQLEGPMEDENIRLLSEKDYQKQLINIKYYQFTKLKITTY